VQDETDWYRISVFGRQAEIADQYLKRGMKVLVDGRLAIRTYTGNDGVERTSVEVTADNFQMLTSRDEMEAGGGGDYHDRGSGRDRQRDDDGGAQRAPAGDRGGRPEPAFDDDDEDLDDVPF
jgi:single-strand DNA-binding protein